MVRVSVWGLGFTYFAFLDLTEAVTQKDSGPLARSSLSTG